jgi:hypothetical protein
MRQKTIITLIHALLVCMLLSVSQQADAIGLEELRQKGLPVNAQPALFFFNHYYDLEQCQPQAADYSQSSWFSEDGDLYVFVEPQQRLDDDFQHISIWVYESATDRVRCVFRQDASHHDDLMVSGLEVLFDKQHRDSSYVDKKTHERITMQRHSCSPVLVARAEQWTGTGHAIRATLIIDGRTGQVQRLDDEQLVGIFHTLTNALMSAEQELAQDYILTTTTHYRVEEAGYQETDDFSIFTHQYLTPVLHIYSASGKRLKTIDMPEDQIDMVR